MSQPSQKASSWTRQLALSTLVACLGSVQYGYHMAELNAPEAVLSCRKLIEGPAPDYRDTWFGQHGYKQCIELSEADVGLVTSILSIGGLLGSSISSLLSDALGRRNASFVNVSFFLVGSFLETLANSKNALATGRFFSGLGAGTSIVNTPLLISEIATNEKKGFLGSLNQFSINIGILSTQLLAIRFANSQQWRYLLFTGFLVAAANIIGLLFINESPKWLVKKNKIAKARSNLSQLRNSDLSSEEDIDNEINEWIFEITGKSAAVVGTTQSNESTLSVDPDLETAGLLDSQQQQFTNHQQVSIRDYLTSSEYFNSKLVVTIIMAGQQFCGINSIIFYGVSVLSALLPKYAVLLNCFISVLNVAVTFLSATIVDKLGRKPLLLHSTAIMGAASVLVSLGILNSYSILTVVAIFTYICAFAIGLGPIPFLLISEVTQLPAASVAQSVGTVLNWLATFLVGYLFPVLNKWIGGYVFALFAIICAVTFILVWKVVPETKGKKNYLQVWSIEERLD